MTTSAEIVLARRAARRRGPGSPSLMSLVQTRPFASQEIAGRQDSEVMSRLRRKSVIKPIKAAATRRSRPVSRRSQRGTSAVEFAIVFPLFFLIFYAIVTYSMIFVAQQSLSLAASEGARAALRFQANATSQSNALDMRASAACTVAANLTNWLASASPCVATHAPCSYDNTMQCVNVALTYNYTGNPIVPTLPLMGMAVPATLVATAMVQLNPENLL